ncbi:MAG TPA: AtpZ/AtpI family protein [Bryobacteraceae bacterium]|jgi:F0F1-type ATP synthase assembly protein I|nr:AtpZ/AtpI family protein [Bryobacteraceae bacterium]
MGDDRKQNPWSQVVRYVSLATMLPLSGLGGYVIGYAIDRALNTHFLSITFLILGTVGGFIQLIHGLGKE